MSIALLDVNFLVSLFDPAHPNHEDAHRWFARHRRHGWASCPITINGCVRVLSNPAYPSLDATPAEVVTRLRVLCASPEHHFWGDSVSLLEGSLFRPQSMAGYRQVTDVYLLGLAVRNQGKLVTFDQRIPLSAVAGAAAHNLEALGTVL